MTYNLEVLGEAAKRISDDLRVRAPAVPWKYMGGKKRLKMFPTDLAQRLREAGETK
jgi:uncharacterized protein with HEPN domain